MQIENSGPNSRRALLWVSFPAIIVVGIAAFTFGTSRMKSAAPIVDRSALKIEMVRRGPLVHHVSGLGALVPEETRWLAAETEAHVDLVFAHAGSRVTPDSILMQLSNPDLERQVRGAELATKKGEAELGKLRVRMPGQGLDEDAAEAQLNKDFD